MPDGGNRGEGEEGMVDQDEDKVGEALNSQRF